MKIITLKEYKAQKKAAIFKDDKYRKLAMILYKKPHLLNKLFKKVSKLITNATN